MKYRISCGIIPIYKESNGQIRFLLVQGHGDYWGFPKGKKEKGETHLDTALRELFEETKLVCSPYCTETIFTERYRIRKKRGDDVIKKVLYFVGLSSTKKITLQTTELKKYGWFTFEECLDKLLDNRKIILHQAFEMLK